MTDLQFFIKFLCLLPVNVAGSSSDGVAICTSGFVNDVTFSHNRPYSGMPLALFAATSTAKGAAAEFTTVLFVYLSVCMSA